MGVDFIDRERSTRGREDVSDVSTNFEKERGSFIVRCKHAPFWSNKLRVKNEVASIGGGDIGGGRGRWENASKVEDVGEKARREGDRVARKRSISRDGAFSVETIARHGDISFPSTVESLACFPFFYAIRTIRPLQI